MGNLNQVKKIIISENEYIIRKYWENTDKIKMSVHFFVDHITYDILDLNGNIILSYEDNSFYLPQKSIILDINERFFGKFRINRKFQDIWIEKLKNSYYDNKYK